MFRRVSYTKTLVVGSLESNTGSEFLFGYDPNKGLKWLERSSGETLSPMNPEWQEAERFLGNGGTNTPPEVAPAPERETVVAGAITRSMGQPHTVQRSAAADGWEDPYPMEGDERIVGDLSTSGEDIPDDDIASQAARFLMENGGGE